MNKIIEDFKEKLISQGVASAKSIVGCSEAEIKDLEDYYAIKLPKIYKEFLKAMGHKSGNYLQGTDFLYKDLFKLRRQLGSILRENRIPFELISTIFVFSGHQGVIFHFFYTTEDLTDPPVYGYMDGEEDVELMFGKFSTYLFAD